MSRINWIDIRKQSDALGYYTYQIKWVPPQSSGFIVQFVEVIDPLKTIRNYDKPYYEAWKIEEGTVLHDGNGSELFDDSFTNEENGDYQICRQLACDAIQNAMKKAGVRKTFISYRCVVFWVDKGTDAYEKICNWDKGDNIGITMARQLRASYIDPGGLVDGKNREYTVDFELQCENE